MRIYQKTFILLLALSASPNAFTVEEFALCKPFAEIAPPRPDLPLLEDDSIRLFADNALVQERIGKSTLTGNVLMQRAEQILKTPRVVYDRNQDILNAEEDFIFWDNHFVISGAKIQLRSETQGEMEQAQYWLLNRRAQGEAEKIIRESEERVSLEQATYTTCDPEHEVWRLSARNVKLDDANAIGTAHHVIIKLLDIPVFYTPYLSFPLSNERKSGFLFPHLGSSDEAGTEFSIPYYFNLAPHYDATLTPRLMSRRGLLLNTEFRYLTSLTGGNLEVEYMPHDQAFGGERASLALRHNGPITERWLADVNLNYVSDERYFEELGNNISVASITHLERRADLFYIGNGWAGLGRLQAFQTLEKNPAARPYQRMPQLVFRTYLPERNRQFNFGLEAEGVRFDRDINVVDAPIGDRIDIKSIFSFPWRTSGTFIVPKLSLRYTRYDLDNVAPAENSSPARGLLTFSADSGLFLERDIDLFNVELLQTLEPRWFYRYTPYKDQTDIPIFDTARYDFSFGQLFREDSFSGADRVDDGHQMTLALTSRFLDSQTGEEHLRASLGQIYYLRDRRVTLPSEPVDTDSSSNLIMELTAQMAKDWRASSTLRWNPHTENTEHTVMRVRYHPDPERILNLSYRLRDPTLEQTDMSFHWTLGTRWNLLGRWNYSLPEEKTLETFVGLEYSSCCWAVRGITRRYLNNIDGESYLNGFFIQFQLKGLGVFGQKTDSFLEQRIPGYHDDF